MKEGVVQFFFEEIVKDFTHLSMKKASIFIPSYKIVETVISFSDFLNFVVDCVIYLQKIMSTMIYINNTDGQSMDVQHGYEGIHYFLKTTKSQKLGGFMSYLCKNKRRENIVQQHQFNSTCCIRVSRVAIFFGSNMEKQGYRGQIRGLC